MDATQQQIYGFDDVLQYDLDLHFEQLKQWYATPQNPSPSRDEIHRWFDARKFWQREIDGESLKTLEQRMSARPNAAEMLGKALTLVHPADQAPLGYHAFVNYLLSAQEFSDGELWSLWNTFLDSTGDNVRKFKKRLLGLARRLALHDMTDSFNRLLEFAEITYHNGYHLLDSWLHSIARADGDLHKYISNIIAAMHHVNGEMLTEQSHPAYDWAIVMFDFIDNEALFEKYAVTVVIAIVESGGIINWSELINDDLLPAEAFDALFRAFPETSNHINAQDRDIFYDTFPEFDDDDYDGEDFDAVPLIIDDELN